MGGAWGRGPTACSDARAAAAGGGCPAFCLRRRHRCGSPPPLCFVPPGREFTVRGGACEPSVRDCTSCDTSARYGRPMRSSVLHLAALLSAAAAMTVPAPAKSNWLVQKLPAGKGSFLLFQWNQGVITIRGNGFSPATEAQGDGAIKMKKLGEELAPLVAQAKILAMCETGGLSFDKLEEPHASIAERLSKTHMLAALSAGHGSAVAFISEWDDHVCIDRCVINPQYLKKGEDAEAHLLTHIAQQAMEAGTTDVRLRPSYQIEDDFYSRIGFVPMEDAEEEGMLCYSSA